MMDSDNEDFSDLKPEHKVFAENYVIAWNGTQSYLEAYPDSSYESAMSSASDLLRKPKVKLYIEHIQKDLAKLAGVSALRNLLELKNLAYTNLSDLKKDWMSEKDFESLTREEKACLVEIQHTTRTFEGGTEKIVKFKLYDKIKAIDMINKMLGYDAAKKIDLNTRVEQPLFPE